MNSSRVTYYDDRYGDTYVIDLDENGEIELIRRYVDQIGRDPIIYDNLSDVPLFHRVAIEQLLK